MIIRLIEVMRSTAIIALLAIIVLGAAGCSLMGYGVSLVVKNESAVTIQVEVLAGGGLDDWSGSLAPGASVTRKGHFNSFGFPGSAAWDLHYTVNGKTARKYGSYDGAHHEATCIITQADVDNL